MKSTESRAILAIAPAAFFWLALSDCGGKASEPDTGVVLAGGTAANPSTTANGGAASTVSTVDTTWAKGGGATVSTSGRSSAGGGTPSTLAPRAPSVHRATAQSCVGVNAPPEPTSIREAEISSCVKHADCTDGVNGKCINGIGMAAAYYHCVYDQCATDADCDPGKICYCTASAAARCLSVGNCRTDADCGSGPYSYCSPSMSWDCGGHRPIDGYHCHTPSDTCMDDSDCTGSDYCNFDAYENRFRCTPTDTSCVIG